MIRTATILASIGAASLSTLAVAQSVPAATAPSDADAWAAKVEAQMTDDERISLVHGFMALPFGPYETAEGRAGWPKDVVLGAGYVRGVTRLSVPSLRETDASLGVANPGGVRPGDSATAMPGGIALGSTFDVQLAYDGGRAIGLEARSKGFNVLLGGGINLMRDPRNGRNFEYISEDPLLSGLMGGAAIRGTQSAGVISTVKHFALNAYETNRYTWNAVVSDAALRESDLLAFQIAIEQGQPGSVMCAYNLVNGSKACGSDYLLNTVLKKDWGYKGWVMSDWGAVDNVDYAIKGLDQQSGEQIDKQVWFDSPLRKKIADGSLSRARLSDMVRRILRSMRATGLVDAGPAPAFDMAANSAKALQIAHEGIVLLKNDGILPLLGSAKSIAVIGDKAHVGVLSGGGSSQVLPPTGWAASVPIGATGMAGLWATQRWMAGSPLDAIRSAATGASVDFDPGVYNQSAAALASRADVAIVFVSKFEMEGLDSPDLSLPGNQDSLVSAVAAANPNTIVVLETGNPVAMPWRDKVRAVVAAWYPGQEGAQAIADVLTGKINPSGHLPITWPAAAEQLPRPAIPGFGSPAGTPVSVEIKEGSDIGYRWFAKHGTSPLYAFGYGLSYTDFSYANLTVTGSRSATATFTIQNTGKREGADVPQLYLQAIDGQVTPRLLAFRRVSLKPGESRVITIKADPRLLASYDSKVGSWRIRGGQYTIALSKAANAPIITREVTLKSALFGK